MNTAEALRRVQVILPMLRDDVRTAVLSHAVMEASNDIIPSGMKGLHCEFTDTYGAVQNALALKLSMDLARIFDLSRGKRFAPAEQDKASVQVLAALLGRIDVQDSLERQAGEWLSGITHVGSTKSAHSNVVEVALASIEEEYRSDDRGACRKAIIDFLAEVNRIDVMGSEECLALRRLREFRDRRLAHSLFDKEPDALPRYSDLNLMLGIAKEATRLASLAVEGKNTEFEDQANRDRTNAERYATCVLDGLKRATLPAMP